jgi:release factor glutamine methyltransferase
MNESELLFTELLGCVRSDLYLNKEKKLDNQTSLKIAQILERRTSGEPLDYILGKSEFMGLEFKVNPNVLIPRPETEILIDTVLKFVPQETDTRHQTSWNILEIGTGSGCIAVSLAVLLANIKIIATDISKSALEVAAENAVLNKVEDKINFITCDLFSSCDLGPGSYDMIISNPPYIPSEEIKNLSAEVQSEPKIALDGGKDGLDFYRRIIPKSLRYLKTGGRLILEMGFGQCPSVSEMFNHSGRLKVKEVIRDYNGIERVIIAEVQGETWTS